MTGLPQGKTAPPIIPILVFPAVILIVMCGSNPAVPETPLPHTAPPAADAPDPVKSGGGAVEEIRRLTENGSPPSLLRALDLIRSREAANTEFGRVMIAVNAALMQKLYPAVAVQFPSPDPPQTHVYTRILRDAEKGVYTPPASNSQDYLEHVLPFLAFYNETRPERLLTALPDLRKGAALNGESVLAPYFLGLLFERTGRLEEASEQYARAGQLSPECYPASLGWARILEAGGRTQD
ncbi:MAG: hypothetical protein LBL43_01835, partial [Treponema sp.]|nr:hypothetical protein [Treponema sp.]